MTFVIRIPKQEKMDIIRNVLIGGIEIAIFKKEMAFGAKIVN